MKSYRIKQFQKRIAMLIGNKAVQKQTYIEKKSEVTFAESSEVVRIYISVATVRSDDRKISAKTTFYKSTVQKKQKVAKILFTKTES